MNLIKKCKYGLMIYNSKDIWVGRSFERYGEYSEAEVQVFSDAIKPGSFVLDIGANIGSHTIALSRIVGPNGLVFAYEPERTNFNTLAGNVSINNLHNVYLFQKAVGSSAGFISVPELDKERTTNFGALSLCEDYSSSQNYPVPLITLDEQNFIRLDFVKIDIEGMEKLALEGGKETIEKLKPLLYIEDDRQEKSKDLLELLESMDYVCYKHYAPLYNSNNFYEEKENVFVTKEEGDIYSQIVSINLFCHHKSIDCPIDTNKFGMAKVN
jgi:FkbM family methyltransferase